MSKILKTYRRKKDGAVVNYYPITDSWTACVDGNAAPISEYEALMVFGVNGDDWTVED